MSKPTKTEHSGAKNGGGYWGTRRAAKKISNKLRRRADKTATEQGHKELPR